jgi:multiple sugar transport system permease protein
MVTKRFIRKFGFWNTIIIFTIFTLFPIYWMIITSLKSPKEINLKNPTFFPQNLVLDNFKKALFDSRFDLFILNSTIVTISASLLVLVFAICGGYALARYKFKGKSIVFAILLGSQLVSSLTTIVPLFHIFTALGVIDRLGCLIIAYTVGNIPFCLITVAAFFQRIPTALEEAALIDGCNKFSAVRRVILPIMLPGIGATFVFAFTGCWNELFYSVMFITNEKYRTIPVGMVNFIGKYDIDWGQMTAAGVMTLLPAAIMFFLVQKIIVSGMTQGAIKE